MNDLKKVIFCGTRGLPANYGGFETAVDEITKNFTSSGYVCDVICRKANSNDLNNHYLGRNLIYVNGSKFKILDTFLSSFQSGFYLLNNRKKYDHIFWFNNANFPGILLSLFTGVPISVNSDGLEWRRSKWSLPFKLYYFFTTFILTKLCKRIISDSIEIQNYYYEKFHKHTYFIPYGVPEINKIPIEKQIKILNDYGLLPGEYFLQITRIEPDNFPLLTAKGFIDSKLAEKGYKFLIIGYRDDTNYSIQLKQLNGIGNIIVHQAIYDPKILFSLRNNCFAYVHGNSVGGTNPALLEALTCCKRIIAIENAFSREVLKDIGIYFQPFSIHKTFIQSLNENIINEQKRNDLLKIYDWKTVSKSYIDLM